MAAASWNDATPVLSICFEYVSLKRIDLIADDAGNHWFVLLTRHLSACEAAKHQPAKQAEACSLGWSEALRAGTPGHRNNRFVARETGDGGKQLRAVARSARA